MYGIHLTDRFSIRMPFIVGKATYFYTGGAFKDLSIWLSIYLLTL